MKLTAELFDPHVDKDIVVHLDDGAPFPLTLTKVTPAGEATPPDGDNETAVHTSFILDLKGPTTPVITALTYPVTAEWMEPTHLFISAYAQDEDGTHYNIVVN